MFIEELAQLDGRRPNAEAQWMRRPDQPGSPWHAARYRCTTLDEYRKYIEKEPPWRGASRSVLVGRNNGQDTSRSCDGIKENTSTPRRRITDGELVSASKCPNDYITRRFLPDKAIDHDREADSACRMEVDSKPRNSMSSIAGVIQLKIEREACEEKGHRVARPLGTAGEGVGRCRGESKRLTSKWQSEKEQVNETQKLKERWTRHVAKWRSRNVAATSRVSRSCCTA